MMGQGYLPDCSTKGCKNKAAVLYLDLLGKLGLSQNKLLRIILGATFDWKDILAYFLGAAIVLGWETRFPKA